MWCYSTCDNENGVRDGLFHFCENIGKIKIVLRGNTDSDIWNNSIIMHMWRYLSLDQYKMMQYTAEKWKEAGEIYVWRNTELWKYYISLQYFSQNISNMK